MKARPNAVEFKYNCSGVDWKAVTETLKRVGMSYKKPHVHKKAFEASHATVFAYDNGKLIGFGRAISDGVYQAAIFDVAILPEFQGRGIGTTIIRKIQDRLSHCNFILYSAPGKEAFYAALGFRKMKTGMALFKKAAAMAENGFTE